MRATAQFERDRRLCELVDSGEYTYEQAGQQVEPPLVRSAVLKAVRRHREINAIREEVRRGHGEIPGPGPERDALLLDLVERGCRSGKLSDARRRR